MNAYGTESLPVPLLLLLLLFTTLRICLCVRSVCFYFYLLGTSMYLKIFLLRHHNLKQQQIQQLLIDLGGR